MLGASAFGIVAPLTIALGAGPAHAQYWSPYWVPYHYYFHHRAEHRQKERRQLDGASKEPFGDIPKGPLTIIISINQQKLHLYSDGVHVADTSVATGVPSLPTPLGVFSVIQKQIFHRSNLYSNAPMPFMQRITWSGVALHEGENIGHRASHGCIRMPHDFAVRLYKLTKIGARVIIANGELKPGEIADPHLFVHKDKEQTSAVPGPADAAKNAAGADNKAPDAAASDVAGKAAALGLRAGNDNPGANFVDLAAQPSTTNPTAPTKSDAEKAPQATPVIATSDAAPPASPNDNAKVAATKKSPIAIFISRKEKKIFVRQNFEPIYEAPVTIENPDQPLGTHVFTAMEYLPDNTTFRWTVVSLPAEAPRVAKLSRIMRDEEDDRYGRHARRRRHSEAHEVADPPPPATPQQALARITIPPDAIDTISQMIVPGSSLIISDQGLGGETGEGTDFIVVAR
jgi:hypothetical protein